MKSWPDIEIPVVPVTITTLDLTDAMSGSLTRLSVPDTTSYIYVCGITPYDSTHIGHATTYVFFDVLHRILIATGKPIVMIENVTDIDDPLFNKADELQRNWQELADEQVARFRKDMTLLRVLPPQQFVSVSEVLPKVVADIAKLLEEDAAYVLDGDIYFNYQGLTATDDEVNTFRDRGGDPDREGKRHPLDPLLWKHVDEPPHFQSPWGYGRPGWHIECVSIIENIAKQPLLIQAGGSDLKFPHHQMSNQQYCALTGESQLAEMYFHVAMVNYHGEKMSKSLGNLVFVDELLSEGYSAMEIRYAILMQDYSTPWEWTTDVLEASRRDYEKLIRALSCETTADATSTFEEVVRALSSNLDTKSALKALDRWADVTLSSQGEHTHAGVVSRTIDALLGIGV